MSLLLAPVYVHTLIVDVRDQGIREAIALGVDIERRMGKPKSIFRINRKCISKKFILHRPIIHFEEQNHFVHSKYNPSRDSDNRRIT